MNKTVNLSNIMELMAEYKLKELMESPNIYVCEVWTDHNLWRSNFCIAEYNLPERRN